MFNIVFLKYKQICSSPPYEKYTGLIDLSALLLFFNISIFLLSVVYIGKEQVTPYKNLSDSDTHKKYLSYRHCSIWYKNPVPERVVLCLSDVLATFLQIYFICSATVGGGVFSLYLINFLFKTLYILQLKLLLMICWLAWPDTDGQPAFLPSNFILMIYSFVVYVY